MRFTTCRTKLLAIYRSQSESCSVVFDSLWPHGLYSPWNSLGQNIGLRSLSLLQGIFPTQGLNPGLSHCRQILYQLSHQGSPRILEWVAYPFSGGCPWPRNQPGSLHCQRILYQLSYEGSPEGHLINFWNLKFFIWNFSFSFTSSELSKLTSFHWTHVYIEDFRLWRCFSGNATAWGTAISLAAVPSDHKSSGLKHTNLSSSNSVGQKASMGPTRLKSHTQIHTTCYSNTFKNLLRNVLTDRWWLILIKFSFNYDIINRTKDSFKWIYDTTWRPFGREYRGMNSQKKKKNLCDPRVSFSIRAQTPAHGRSPLWTWLCVSHGDV